LSHLAVAWRAAAGAEAGPTTAKTVKDV